MGLSICKDLKKSPILHQEKTEPKWAFELNLENNLYFIGQPWAQE